MDVTITVILECNSCRKDSNKESPCIFIYIYIYIYIFFFWKAAFSYITQKNRHNMPSRLELRKLCPYCYKHMIHEEIKK